MFERFCRLSKVCTTFLGDDLACEVTDMIFFADLRSDRGEFVLGEGELELNKNSMVSGFDCETESFEDLELDKYG